MRFILWSIFSTSVLAITCPTGLDSETWTSGSKSVSGCKGTLKSVISSTTASDCNTGELSIWINAATGATSAYDYVLSTAETSGFRFNAPIVGTTISGTTLDITDLNGKVVGNSNIKDDAIKSVHIVAGSVNSRELASNSVRAEHIQDGQVGKAEIGSNAVGSSELKNDESFTMKTLTTTGSCTIADSLNVADGAFVVQDKWKGGAINNWAKIVLKGHLRIQDSPTESQLGISSEVGYQLYFRNADWDHPVWTTNWGADAFSIWAKGAIHSGSYIGSSDTRIKKDIRSLQDEESLLKIRQLDAKAYKYKDPVERGTSEVVGFIAQDVLTSIPSAVHKHKNFIPDELRGIAVSWQKIGSMFRMIASQSLDPGRYRFKFFSQNSSAVTTEELETKDGKTFFKEDDEYFTGNQYKPEVLLYGKEVDDFLSIDKQRIFAVAYSALQQVDKNQQTLQQKVNTLEATVAKLEAAVATLAKQLNI